MFAHLETHVEDSDKCIKFPVENVIFDLATANVLKPYLEHSHPVVRRTAVSAVGRLLEKNDCHIFNDVSSYLVDSDATVRGAAISSLAAICGKGDERVIEAAKM